MLLKTKKANLSFVL